MRRLELNTPLARDAATAWAVFIDTHDWPTWSRLVTAAEGELVPGHVWNIQLRGTDGRAQRRMHPRFVSQIPGQRIVFETRIGGSWVIRMVHIFDIVPQGPERSSLRQRFEITGLLVWPFWGALLPGMMQFEQLGVDLARRLEQTG